MSPLLADQLGAHAPPARLGSIENLVPGDTLLDGLQGAARPAFLKGALDEERLGLFPARDFQLTTGKEQSDGRFAAAFWYFREEVTAVPRPGLPLPDLAPTRQGYTRVLRQARAAAGGGALPCPPLVWVAAPEIAAPVALAPDGTRILSPSGEAIPLALVPRLPTNRSFSNAATTAFFQGRPLRLRGHFGRAADGGTVFTARTIWPEDFRIDLSELVAQPLAAGQTLADLITADGGGASGPFRVRLLWERTPGGARAGAGRPVLALVLSGAQGDDDESQGGHMAVATGRLGAGGGWADWLANNVYSLDEVSEKGILPGPVPMDNYLMDLNSGQSYYRPVYLLAAVLGRERAAARCQAFFDVLFPYFYRHDVRYEYARRNSTALSIDPLRELGWRIPRRGRTGFLMGVLVFLYGLVGERSLSRGRELFNDFVEEQTRLLPRVAFEAAGQDLLQLVQGRAGPDRQPLAGFEEMLRDDVDAVVFARLPQIPSSRAPGTFPVGSLKEYRQRAPSDRSKWRTSEVKPRPFPPSLGAPPNWGSH